MEFCIDVYEMCPLWGLPAWWTPNWGHRVAPVLGSFSPLGVTQARFLNRPCPGRPHFGVRLADPELGPLIQNVLRVGPPGGPSFELVFCLWEFQNVFCIAVSGVGPFGGSLRGPRIGSADTNPLWWVHHAANFSIRFRYWNMCRER